eukprot:g42094.t1
MLPLHLMKIKEQERICMATPHQNKPRKKNECFNAKTDRRIPLHDTRCTPQNQNNSIFDGSRNDFAVLIRPQDSNNVTPRFMSAINTSIPYHALEEGKRPQTRTGLSLLLGALGGFAGLRWLVSLGSKSLEPFTPPQGLQSVTLDPVSAAQGLPISLAGVSSIFIYGPMRVDTEGVTFSRGSETADAKVYGAALVSGSPVPFLTGRSADAITGRLLSWRPWRADFSQKLAAADRWHNFDAHRPDQGLWQRTVVPAVTRAGQVVPAIWYYQRSAAAATGGQSYPALASMFVGGRPGGSGAAGPAKDNKGTHDEMRNALQHLGIRPEPTVKVVRNPNYPELARLEANNQEGVFANNGALMVDTGKFTGRSPADKYIVQQSPSKDHIWWGEVNQPMSPEVFAALYQKVVEHFSSQVGEIYVFDGYAGANPKTRKKVRFVTELAWQSHFVRNMFVRPAGDLHELEGFLPDFTIINACKVTAKHWREMGLHSEVFIAFNIEQRVAIIGGTYYAGEMKKGIFSMMQYWLPLEKVLTMHCSANRGPNGDTALFFGLSGTGKTALSADPKRALIGDDEHGWDEDGVFNLEGGCYAKTINLSEQSEPEIYHAIRRDAILENVYVPSGSNVPNYTNAQKTENGRVSYPIYHIKNYEASGRGDHPSHVIFLTCDAYGVLPPVARLSPGQAMYYFLSGYTAKVAGTERGVNEPVATFSAGFGAAFLPLHPTQYAELLREKLEKHGSQVYLVNTGWTGGQYGKGQRISLKLTRACIDAILDGTIAKAPATRDPIFGLDVPTAVPSLPSQVLHPREAWQDQAAYDKVARKLAKQFHNNFGKFKGHGIKDYSKYGPLV